MITPSTKFTPAPLLARPVAQAKIRRRRGVFVADPSRNPTSFSNPKPNPAGAARGRAMDLAQSALEHLARIT
jgi:hypothetical protein